MPLGSEKALMMGASAGGADANYFGDGSDGSLTTSADEIIPQETDTDDVVILQYTQLTVSSGDSMYRGTVNGRGVFIYVTGNCTINGALHVDATDTSGTAGGTGGGPNADPETSTDSSDGASVSSTGLRLPMFTASGTETLAAADWAGCGNPVIDAVANQPGISGDGTIYQIKRTDAASVSGNSSPNGNDGTTGADSIGGGSGGGGAAVSTSGTNGSSGPGFCWGGGGGTGASAGDARASGNAPFSSPSGQSTGGAGWWGQRGGTGGRGAGMITLVVGGDLTIGASGRISANAGNGGSGNGSTGCGGGGGGGVVLVLYAGTLSNSGTIEASGGSGVGSGPNGGNGGAGGVRIAQVSAA